MQRYFNVVQDRQGNAIAGASVRVELAGGALATIFGVNNTAVPIPNPVQSNTEGEYFFYAPNGSYTLRITAPGYGSEVIPDVALVDARDLINEFNQPLAPSSPFIQGLLDDIDAAAARTTLGAVGTLGNETIADSKTFTNGIGVAGQAAAETGWTTLGYLRGLLLPATRAIWWAKGAATRSIGIVRQSGSNLLRLVSSTADDGSAAAFDAMTVDTATGNVTAAGTIFGGGTVTGASFVSTAADASNGGKLEIAKPTGSGLSGNAALRMLNNSAILQDLGNSRHVFFDLVKAAVAGSDGFFVVESNLVVVGGYLVFSNGFIMQWGITDPIASGESLVVTFPKPYQSSIFIAIPVDTGTTNNSFSVPARSNTNFTAFRKSHGSGGGSGLCAWFSFGV